jgi:hypothetical protein
MSSPRSQPSRHWPDSPPALSAAGAELGRYRRHPALPINISLVRYAPALLLLITAVLDSVQYADTDLWGHVRFGQIMLATHHLIRKEIFSYSASGLPWTNHEWLSEVVMAVFYNTMGVPGLKLMKFLCAGATVLMLAIGLAETGAGTTLQFGVLIAVSIGLQLQIQFRPQLFDYVFLSAMLALLARHRNGRNAPLWLVLPIMVLWANLHGGFFIGIVVLGVYTTVTGVLDLLDGSGIERAAYLGMLTGFAALLSLINPYGFNEWRIVAHTLQNPYTMGAGTEFQSFFHVFAGIYRHGSPVYPLMVALLIMAAFAVSFAIAPQTGDLPEVAIAALMVVLALYSVRNTAFAVIACAAPTTRHLHLIFSRKSGRLDESLAASGEEQLQRPERASRLVQIAALIAAMSICISNKTFYGPLPDFTDFPVGAVGFMQQHHLNGRIFNRLIWGSYILWHMPDAKVFIDGRFEMIYPPAVQRDYIDFLGGRESANRVLEAYPHDFVLDKTGAPSIRLVAAQPGWRLIYEDPVASLFARSDSPATRIPGVPVVRKTAPPSFFP